MTSDSLSLIRNGSFAALGLILLGYACAVLLTGRPDPVSPIIPGAAGVLCALITWGTARMAASGAGRAAWDEQVRTEWNRAVRRGWYVAIWLYPIFALFLAQEMIGWGQAFAAMGTLTGAAPFLFFLASWGRGRV